MGAEVQLLGYRESLPKSEPHGAQRQPPRQGDERSIVSLRDVALEVVEVHPHSGTAAAVDGRGRRYALSDRSAGIDIRQLRVGQHLIGDASRFSFILAARLQ